MGTFFRALLLMILSIFFLPGGVEAAAGIDIFPQGGKDVETGNIQIGRVKVHPGFAFETRYEDNVFLEADQTFANGTSEGRTDDFIFINQPYLGLKLDRLEGELFGFDLSYRGNDEHFLNLSNTQDVFEHRIAGSVNLGGPGGRGDLTFGGSYFSTQSIESRDLQTNIGNRVSNKERSVYADFIVIFRKTFRVKAHGDFQQRTFGGTLSREDRDTYNFGGSIFWQFTKLTALGVKYNHRLREYPEVSAVNFDSNSDQVFVAIRWEPTALVRGEVAVGYDTKRFKGIAGQDRQDVIYQIDLEYHPVDRTNFVLTGVRSIQDSSFGVIQAYLSSSVGLTWYQKLGKKFSTEIGASFQNLDYDKFAVDTPGGGVLRVRKDNSVSTVVALVYDIQKWLKARAVYRFENNNSNFDDRDFKSNTGVLNLSLAY